MNGIVAIQHVADQPPDAAVADDDDAGLLAFRRGLRRRFVPGRSRRQTDAAPSFASPGIASIDSAITADQRRRERAIDEASRQGGADHHEAELAGQADGPQPFMR